MAHYNRGRSHSSLGPGILDPWLGELESNPAGIGYRSFIESCQTDLGGTAPRTRIAETCGVTLPRYDAGGKIAWQGVSQRAVSEAAA